jgi:hypothetical protein
MKEHLPMSLLCMQPKLGVGGMMSRMLGMPAKSEVRREAWWWEDAMRGLADLWTSVRGKEEARGLERLIKIVWS